MLSPNKFTGFFDNQYPWKETTNVLDFLHRVNNQGKIACKIAIVGWLWPCMFSHGWTSLELAEVNLVGLGIVWPH